MTVTLGGNGLQFFDSVVLTSDAGSVTIDIRDDASQDICLVTGTVGCSIDNSYGRFKLQEADGTDISAVRGRSAVVGNTTTTSSWGTTAVGTNIYGVGSQSFMLWINASRVASEPYRDVHCHGFMVTHGTGTTVYIHRNAWYYEATPAPYKLVYYWNQGNITTADIKSYLIAANHA